MKMKKFINNPENLTPELLEGFAEAHKELVTLGENRMIINNKLAEADRVTIVTQGGSGHEPAISGFVGEGMVDISVVGDVFAAPGPQACLDAIKLADKGKGVLYIVLNHAGDMLTGNLTMKKCAKEGLNVVKVVTQEDIANAPRSNADDRRGLVGCIPTYKIAGAAAAEGKSVIIIQFLKGKETRSVDFLEQLDDLDIKIFRFEKRDCCYDDLSDEEKAEERSNILNGLNFARKVVVTQECDFLLLDEILGVMEQGIVSVETVADILRQKDESMQIVMTGTNLPEGLRPYVDTVIRLTEDMVGNDSEQQ